MRIAAAKRSLVPIALVLSAACAGAGAADTYVEGFDWHAHDPILYEDITIDAMLAGVEFKVVDAKVIDPSFRKAEGAIGVLQLDDARVLRGGRLHLPVYVEVFVDWRKLVGQRLILCARWRPALGGYIVRNAKSVLLRKNDSWERMEPQEVVPDGQMALLALQGRQEELARRAELIVEGVVTIVQDSTVTVDGEYRGKIRRVTIDDVQVLAGTSPNRNLVFETYGWVARVPKLQVGERWVVFLERVMGRWRVMSGVNGLLRESDNGELFLGGRAPLARSRAQLFDMLGEVRSED